MLELLEDGYRIPRVWQGWSDTLYWFIHKMVAPLLNTRLDFVCVIVVLGWGLIVALLSQDIPQGRVGCNRWMVLRNCLFLPNRCRGILIDAVCSYYYTRCIQQFIALLELNYGHSQVTMLFEMVEQNPLRFGKSTFLVVYVVRTTTQRAECVKRNPEGFVSPRSDGCTRARALIIWYR